MKEVYIHPTAVVDETAKIGEGTKVWHFVNVREKSEIGKNCILGHSVYVGRRVKIGDDVKLQNRATVYEGVTIENNVFVGPHVTFTNDPYPRSFNKDWKIVKTLVRRGASIGAGSIVMCGVVIGEYAMIGAGSVVTTDIPAHALAYGNPTEVRGFACRCGRGLKKEGETQDFVLMQCPSCSEEHRVLRKDYARIS